MKTKLTLSTALAAHLLASSSYGQDVLTPTDSRIISQTTTQTVHNVGGFGHPSEPYVIRTRNDGDASRINATFIRFDVSSLTVAEVNSPGFNAEFQIDFSSAANTISTSLIDFQLGRNTIDDWTWDSSGDNNPLYSWIDDVGSEQSFGQFNGSTIPATPELDITSIVQGWVNGTFDNLGLIFYGTQVVPGSGQNAFGFEDARISIVSEPVSSLRLVISPATPPATGFDLEWDSQAGKLYNLLTSTDLADPIAEWDLIEGDIAANPPANVMNVPEDGPRRFYAVEEFDAPPPPPLLDVDFEEDDGGFTSSADEGTAWEWGTPDSNGLGGTVDAGNDADPGTGGAWGTNLGAYDEGTGDAGFYANPTVNSWLISPVIDLTEVVAAELTFAQAIDLHGDDSALVRIYDTATGDEIVGGDFPLTVTDPDITEAPWEDSGPHELPVGATIRIEWILDGSGGADADFMGWYIDDVVVTETTPLRPARRQARSLEGSARKLPHPPARSVPEWRLAAAMDRRGGFPAAWWDRDARRECPLLPRMVPTRRAAASASRSALTGCAAANPARSAHPTAGPTPEKRAIAKCKMNRG